MGSCKKLSKIGLKVMLRGERLREFDWPCITVCGCVGDSTRQISRGLFISELYQSSFLQLLYHFNFRDCNFNTNPYLPYAIKYKRCIETVFMTFGFHSESGSQTDHVDRPESQHQRLFMIRLGLCTANCSTRTSAIYSLINSK